MFFFTAFIWFDRNSVSFSSSYSPTSSMSILYCSSNFLLTSCSSTASCYYCYKEGYPGTKRLVEAKFESELFSNSALNSYRSGAYNI